MSNLVQPTGKLKQHEKIFNAVLKIQCKIKEFPKWNDLKLNTELTIFAGCLLENLISKKYNVDKKELLVTIFKDIFSLTDDEVNILSSQIDFLNENGMIKKISSLKIMSTSIANFFLRQFHG